ncbi:unnamed protein product [Caenorhabditis auriculariae]|uniref:Uncharacterized protein n=1 Tax=Caenorhabditis auriculariae TaxID=2777116 RepID=A0A8S1HIK2_9PELO|nr:unnamed protein product [Caenorhabditis auriculariae]
MLMHGGGKNYYAFFDKFAMVEGAVLPKETFAAAKKRILTEAERLDKIGKLSVDRDLRLFPAKPLVEKKGSFENIPELTPRPDEQAWLPPKYSCSAGLCEGRLVTLPAPRPFRKPGPARP